MHCTPYGLGFLQFSCKEVYIKNFLSLSYFFTYAYIYYPCSLVRFMLNVLKKMKNQKQKEKEKEKKAKTNWLTTALQVDNYNVFRAAQPD